MRYLVASLFLLLFWTSAPAQAFETYGTTEAQILKMGMVAWSDFYTSKAGTSTADMAQAAQIYGVVAKRRNDGLLGKHLDADYKGKILKLRKLLGQLAKASVDIGYAESGGGTIYIPMWASLTGEVEDTLYSILSGAEDKTEPMVVSMVTKELAKVRRSMEAMHRDAANSEFMKYDDAKKAVSAMQKSFDQIAALAKSMSRKDSDRLLSFCLYHAKNANPYSPQ